MRMCFICFNGKTFPLEAAKLGWIADRESYLYMSCNLRREISPDRTGHLDDGPGYENLCTAHGISIDPSDFVDHQSKCEELAYANGAADYIPDEIKSTYTSISDFTTKLMNSDGLDNHAEVNGR